MLDLTFFPPFTFACQLTLTLSDLQRFLLYIFAAMVYDSMVYIPFLEFWKYVS